MNHKAKTNTDHHKASPRTRRSKDQNDAWQWSKKGKPDPLILEDIVKRIVRAAKPERIVLFGSAARGTMGPNSDIDLLVIKAGKFNRHRVTVAIYRELRGKGAPTDIVVVTPDEVERYRNTHCLVICPALEEGKIVYDSKTPIRRRSA